MSILDQMRAALEALPAGTRPLRFELDAEQWSEMINWFVHVIEWRPGEPQPRFEGLPVHRVPEAGQLLMVE